ncbi:hypothetical protein [Methylorubrum sp. SB2]|uniref:hypothetical protein n=1 Tax=Methylorubrum subtropicum TaxID=3138812 RepID=UPI00313D10AA
MARTRGSRAPLERHATPLLIITGLAVVAAGLSLCAILSDPSLFGGPWWVVALFAATLAAATSAIFRQSRLTLMPGPGLLLGGAALFLMTTQRALDPMAVADHQLDGLVLVLNALRLDGTGMRERLASLFGQTAGLSLFLGNLTLVVAYAVVRLFGIGLLGLLMRIPGSGLAARFLGGRWDRPDLARIWTNRTLAILTLTVVVSVYLQLVALAAFAAWKGRTYLFLGDFELSRLTWAATFVFLVELAAAFHPERSHMVQRDVKPEPLPEPDLRLIRQLYAALEASGVSGFVSIEPDDRAPDWNTVESRAARANLDADPRVADLLRTVERSLAERDDPSAVTDAVHRLAGPVADFYASDIRDSSVLVLAETITTTHYRVFGQMILSALDAGGVVLLVCPDGQDRAVRNEIENVFQRTRVGLMAETLLLGETFDEHQLYEVLIASETALEHELLANADRHRRELDRLTLIIGLDLHRIELSRMSLMLRRLRREATFDEIRLAFTLTDFGQPENVVRQIFLDGLPRRVAMARIGSHASEGLYRFALPDTADNRGALRTMTATISGRDARPAQRRSPLEDVRDSAALIALAAMQVGLPVVFHDPRGRRIPEGADTVEHQTWSFGTMAAVERFLLRGEDAQRFRNIVARRSLPTSDTLSRYGRVVIVEESLNADAALTRPYDFLDQYPTLVVVLLRDAHLMSDKDILAIMGPGGPILPSTPTPAVGARGIAYILEPRLRTGIRETELAQLLRSVPDKVKTGYGFAANRAGLGRLLTSATRTEAIRFRPDEMDAGTGEPIFRLDEPSPPSGLTVDLDIRPRVEDGKVRIVANDVGLRFVAGAYTAIRTPFELVRSVSGLEIDTEAAPAGECSYEQRRFARVCPVYAGVVGEAFKVEAGPTHARSRSDKPPYNKSRTTLHSRVTLLSGPVRRNARRWYAEVETVPPFNTDGAFIGTSKVVEASEVVTVERPMRMLHIAWMLDSDIGAKTAGKPAGKPVPEPAPGPPPPPDPKLIGETAVAAAVLLKEAIVACFPGQGHRVWVTSPQAARRLAAEPEGEDGARYIADRYALASTIDVTPWLDALSGEEERQPFDREGASRIDLFVIEDSEWSLGVIEPLARPSADVYRFMLRALDKPPTFGARQPPPYMGLQSLRAFVEVWMSERPMR